MEDKLPKIDTGQIKEETEGDGRDREREWNYKNNNHHITHTTNVSCHVINEITPGSCLSPPFFCPSNRSLKTRAYWLPIEN
jgi:hypothetical protein